MRKIFIAIFISIALLPVFAGGKKDKAAGDGPSGSITVWLDDDRWAREVLAAFKKKYPAIRVNYEKIGSVDARTKVALDGPAGIGPDVFIMPHDNMALAVQDGVCEPFSPEDQEKYGEILLEASMKTCVFDGKLYGLPISTENIGFFYNKRLLGNSPVPTSFEELKAFAEKWNAENPGNYALRWEVENAYINYFFLTAFGMSLFGPDMKDYKQPGWDSEAAKQGVEFHNSLRPYFDINAENASFEATVGAFQKGQVPFTITGPWAIADAKRNGVDFGVGKLPTINGVQPRCFSGNIIAAVSHYSKNLPAALAFVDFLVSLEGASLMYKTVGKLPAYKDSSGIESLQDDAHLRGILEQAPYSDPMPIIPEMAQAWEAQKALFYYSWDKQFSVPDAQKRVMEIYDTALLMQGKSR